MSQEQQGFIELGDKEESRSLYFEASGTGAPVIFSHAGFVDRRMWDDQWQRFAQDYQVVRFDMHGFGKSEAAAMPVDRRADLHRLLAKLDIKRAILIGCSLSGEIVLDFALEQPDKVAALVLVSTVPSGFEMQGEPPAHLLEMMAAMQAGDVDRASDLQNRIWVAGSFRQPEQVDVQVWQRAAQMNRIAIQNQTFFKMDAAAQFRLDPPAVQRLGELSVPTLLVAGALDHPEVLRANDLMATSIPGAQKAIIPDTAHLPNMEEPAHFNRVVLDFLHANTIAV